MLFHYFDIDVSQSTIGQALRPYQNKQGDNDDKSVSLSELAAEAQKYNYIAYYRPNGSIDTLKQFISADIPVITETLLSPTDDIGHYRLIRGYDDTKKILIQDDPFDGHAIQFSYSEFDRLWQPFAYQFMVMRRPVNSP
jgi:hypothetical protein